MNIILPFPVSVNGAYGGGSGQKRFKTKALKKWLERCPKLIGQVIEYPVHVHYVFFWPDKRLRDGQNYQKVVLDFIVNQGVLIDDNYSYVASESWSHGGVDKEAPRVEVTITVK